MAIDSRDPVTGAPQFSDTGAPDIGVDPTEVAKFAADVGTRIIRASLAELEAYEWKRAGLAGHADGIDYLHNGTGWVQQGASVWVAATPATGWTATEGYPPQVRRDGSRVDLRGAVTIGSGGSFASMLTVPVGFRPADSSKIVGAFHGSATGVYGEMFIATSGVLTVPAAYRTGTAAVGTNIPVAGFWHID